MDFTTLKGNTLLNLDLFVKAEESESTETLKKSTTNLSIYTEDSLMDLREHCQGIVEKGEEATDDEIDSLIKALQEVETLKKAHYEENGIIVAFYYKGDLPQ